MTIPTSSIAAALTAVYTAIAAQPNVITVTGASVATTTPILLCYIAPAGKYLPDDIIAIGEQIDVVDEVHALVGSGGPHAMQEQFSISGKCSSWRGGEQPLAALTAAKTLADLVTLSIRTDPSLGGAVLWAWPRDFRYRTGWSEQAEASGFLSEADFTIACRAES